MCPSKPYRSPRAQFVTNDLSHGKPTVVTGAATLHFSEKTFLFFSFLTSFTPVYFLISVYFILITRRFNYPSLRRPHAPNLASSSTTTSSASPSAHEPSLRSRCHRQARLDNIQPVSVINSSLNSILVANINKMTDNIEKKSELTHHDETMNEHDNEANLEYNEIVQTMCHQVAELHQDHDIVKQLIEKTSKAIDTQSEAIVAVNQTLVANTTSLSDVLTLCKSNALAISTMSVLLTNITTLKKAEDPPGPSTPTSLSSPSTSRGFVIPKKSASQHSPTSRFGPYTRPKPAFPKPAPDRSSVQCCFCRQVGNHFSRECPNPMPINVKLLVLANENRCHKCCRKITDAHNSKCKPDLCSLGCVDDDGNPLFHEDWLCPANPDLPN